MEEQPALPNVIINLVSGEIGISAPGFFVPKRAEGKCTMFRRMVTRRCDWGCLLALCLFWIVVAISNLAAGATIQAMVFNTSDNPFHSGSDNQGWWSDTWANSSPTNDYYNTSAVGATAIRPASELRSFFTFDLSSLSGTVVSAKLEVMNYSTNAGTLGLFDVSTNAALLNDTVGTSASIHADLGGGISYGEFAVQGFQPTNAVLTFALNEAAVFDIKTAAGQFFSIGGRSMEFQAVPSYSDTIFGSSGSGGPQRLVVDVIPEPYTITLLGLGGLALRRRGGWKKNGRNRVADVEKGWRSLKTSPDNVTRLGWQAKC